MKTTWLGASLLVGLFAACKTTAPVPSPWANYVTGTQPGAIWLSRSDHTVVRVDGPRMFGDTVVGMVDGQYTEIPLTDVTQLMARRADKGKTIALAVAGGAVTAAALAVILTTSGTSAAIETPCNVNTMDC
jgi:hypothetical protein